MSPSEFQHIVTELRPDLLRVGQDFFASSDDAEDVAQETCVKLWEFCQRMGEPRNVRALAVRIAKNVCVDMQRRRHGALFVALDGCAFVDEHNAQIGMEQKEASRRLHAAMQTLAERERQLLEMRLVQELTAEEIAQQTGIPKPSVLSMISMAKRKIIKLLNSKNP